MGNDAHQHLLVNHLPIFAAFLSIPMLVMTLLLRRERGLLLASVFLLVAAGLGGWLSYTSGEKAWDMIQDVEGKGTAMWTSDVDGEAILEHEERAEKASWIAGGTAVLGIAVLWAAHRRPPENPLPRWPVAGLLFCAIVTSAGMAYTGNAGGVIIHREIRGDSLDSTTPPK